MSEHNCFEHVGFGYFITFCFNHHDCISSSSYYTEQIALIFLLGRWVNDELTVHSTNNNAAYRTVKWNIRYAKRRRSTDHRCDLWGTILINTKHKIYNLNIVTEAFGKQRTNRSIG